MAEVLIVSRLLQFAAVIVVFGCGAFRLYGLAIDITTTSTGALITFDAWFWRVTIVGAIIALLSGLSLLLAVTAKHGGLGYGGARHRYDQHGAVQYQLRARLVLAAAVRIPPDRRLPRAASASGR